MTKEDWQESLNFSELIDLFLETENRNSANFNKGKWNELYEECIMNANETILMLIVIVYFL